MGASRKPAIPKLMGNGDVVDTITMAGRNRKTVTITYVDSKGQTTVRETEPYEIKDDAYYGYCHIRNSIRKFLISNITDAKINDRSFQPRWEVKF